MRRTGADIGAAFFPGAVAAVLSSLVIVACGRMENGRALATHNGPAQWVHGKAAGHRRSLTLRHTLLGFIIHFASSWWWAFVQRRLFPARPGGAALRVHALEGGAIALLANIVDYQLVPERLQPGFEKHISRKSLAAAYVAFGLGLALATWWCGREEAGRGRASG